jgi:hypothetical protein
LGVCKEYGVCRKTRVGSVKTLNDYEYPLQFPERYTGTFDTTEAYVKEYTRLNRQWMHKQPVEFLINGKEVKI